MRKSLLLSITLGMLLSMAATPLAQQAQQPPALSFDFYRTNVEPIFLKRRAGHARCYACHSQGTPLRLQELSPGSAGWNEEQSKKNFEAVRRMVNPNDPAKSMLLIHPLATDAGGDLFHNGGKHWTSQTEPEWQTLLAWVKGKR